MGRDFKSEFDDQQRFEESEMERTGRKQGNLNTALGLGNLGLVKNAQKRNKAIINSQGIGYTTKEAKKPSWKNEPE